MTVQHCKDTVSVKINYGILRFVPVVVIIMNIDVTVLNLLLLLLLLALMWLF